MVGEYLLPEPFQKQRFFIGLLQIYTTKKELKPISPIGLTSSSSSPAINSRSTTRTLKTASTKSDDASTSSKNASTKSDVSDTTISSEISSNSTDNTLSMITTPWTTESWSSESIVETYSGTVMSTMATSLTINPESTTSIVGITSDLNSASINTVTLFEINEPESCFSVDLHSVTSSCKMKIKAKSYSDSTFESWAIESFTSFVEYSDSNILKVRYPWSPCTSLSGTDIYPDSMDTFQSSISLMTPTIDSVKQSIFTSSTKVF